MSPSPTSDTDRTERFPATGRSQAAVVAILGLAAFTRIYEIDTADVWVDEANAILMSKESLGGLFQRLRLDSSPPAYYILLHFWVLAFGDGAVAVRLLSALSGIALVIVTWWAGRDLISPRVGLWAALFVAASPIQAFYSQQARMYAMLPVLALLSVAFLVRYLRGSSKADFRLWIGTTLLALLTHHFAFYLLAVHGALIALSGRLVSDWRHWLGAALVTALGYSPWTPFLLDQIQNRDHYAWFVGFWDRIGPEEHVQLTFQSYSPSGTFAQYAGLGPPPGGVWAALGVAALVTALAGFGAYSLWSSRRERGLVGAGWPLIFLVLPILASLAVSMLGTPNYVAGRVDQMMLPAFALLVGVGIHEIRPVPLGVLVATSIVVIGVWSKFGLYPEDPGRGLEGGNRELARRVAERASPRDVILCTSLSRAPLEYYLGRAGIDTRLLSFPRDTALHLGSQNDVRLLSDPRALDREAVLVVERARSLLDDDGRLFLIRVRSEVNAFLRHAAMLRRFGFRGAGGLGRFHQSGTGLQLEARIYRLGRERQGAPSAGSAQREAQPTR